MEQGLVNCTALESAVYRLIQKGVEIAMLLAPKDTFLSSNLAGENRIAEAR
jgi:hypothetical protein